jgi:hypothetical protein
MALAVGIVASVRSWKKESQLSMKSELAGMKWIIWLAFLVYRIDSNSTVETG